MSANVWFEEVSVGLINEIKNTVKIKDTKGVLIPIDNVIVRKPEEDFKLEVFPCASIYIKSFNYDYRRYDTVPATVSIDVEHNTKVIEDSAIPFVLDCQVDFWAEYQTDMDIMLRTWLYTHFHQFNLNVIDDGGTERLCNCLAQRDIIKSDLVKNLKRLYHSIINLQIWVELDEEIRYNVPMTGKDGVNINI